MNMILIYVCTRLLGLARKKIMIFVAMGCIIKIRTKLKEGAE